MSAWRALLDTVHVARGLFVKQLEDAEAEWKAAQHSNDVARLS